MQTNDTIPTADNPSSISTRGLLAGEQQSAVAVCCLISAKMLELSDSDGHSDLQRRGFRELNANQAALLREAAKIADEMLAALREIERGVANTGSDPHQWMTTITKHDAWLIARAAISKATGA